MKRDRSWTQGILDDLLRYFLRFLYIKLLGWSFLCHFLDFWGLGLPWVLRVYWEAVDLLTAAKCLIYMNRSLIVFLWT